MKTYILFVIGLYLIGSSNVAKAQYNGCPNQGSDVVGHLDWRLRDASTNAVISSAPQPGTIYKLEIYETPYNPVSPDYRDYQTVGIMGSADGFKVYSSVYNAQNNPNDYFSDATLAAGVGPDVGTSGGVATFGIKTLDASDPNWSGQLTAFKAYGQCYPSLIGYPSKFYKKTLVKLP